MDDKCNYYRFSPRDSLSGAVAQIADYLSKHPGWNETELRAFIDSLNISNGVETFNDRSGNVTLNKDDVNNLLIANCYFAEADETIESIDVLALYKLGIRIVFTQYSSEVDGYTLAYGIEYYPATDTAKAYLFSSGSGGGTDDIVSVNGKTGAVNLKVVDVSNGNSPDENAYIFIDESDDYPEVISSDSNKLGGQLPSYYAPAEEVSQLKDDLAKLESTVYHTAEINNEYKSEIADGRISDTGTFLSDSNYGVTRCKVYSGQFLYIKTNGNASDVTVAFKNGQNLGGTTLIEKFNGNIDGIIKVKHGAEYVFVAHENDYNPVIMLVYNDINGMIPIDAYSDDIDNMTNHNNILRYAIASASKSKKPLYLVRRNTPYMAKNLVDYFSNVSIISNGATIRITDDAVYGDFIIKLTHANNLFVDGIIFDGNNSNQAEEPSGPADRKYVCGIIGDNEKYSSSISNIEFHNCTFRNTQRGAVIFKLTLNNACFDNCKFEKTDCGIITMGNVNTLNITGCIFDGAGNSWSEPISLYPMESQYEQSNITIRRCTIKNKINGNGILIGNISLGRVKNICIDGISIINCGAGITIIGDVKCANIYNVNLVLCNKGITITNNCKDINIDDIIIDGRKSGGSCGLILNGENCNITNVLMSNINAGENTNIYSEKYNGSDIYNNISVSGSKNTLSNISAVSSNGKKIYLLISGNDNVITLARNIDVIIWGLICHIDSNGQIIYQDANTHDNVVYTVGEIGEMNIGDINNCRHKNLIAVQ